MSRNDHEKKPRPILYVCTMNCGDVKPGPNCSDCEKVRPLKSWSPAGRKFSEVMGAGEAQTDIEWAAEKLTVRDGNRIDYDPLWQAFLAVYAAVHAKSLDRIVSASNKVTDLLREARWAGDE